MKKMPPKEKIYEAWSALADQRLRQTGPDHYEVDSSDRTSTYTVVRSGSTYASDDKATYWQGYPGYPVLAVLMTEGLLPVSESTVHWFAGIPWKKINQVHKRDYAAAAEEVLSELAGKGADPAALRAEMEACFSRLAGLEISVRRYTGKG